MSVVAIASLVISVASIAISVKAMLVQRDTDRLMAEMHETMRWINGGGR